jgi:hypothetical protein
MNALGMLMAACSDLCAAATFADLRGISVNQIAEASSANFFKLFHRATV